MVHIVLTGPMAGYVLCGADRTADTNDTFEHLSYSREGITRQESLMCPACKVEYDAAMNDD